MDTLSDPFLSNRLNYHTWTWSLCWLHPWALASSFVEHSDNQEEDSPPACGVMSIIHQVITIKLTENGPCVSMCVCDGKTLTHFWAAWKLTPPFW